MEVSVSRIGVSRYNYLNLIGFQGIFNLGREIMAECRQKARSWTRTLRVETTILKSFSRLQWAM